MIKLRTVEPEDAAPLAETLPSGFRNTTRETWLQRFENWWTLNPAFTPGLPRGWLLEEDGKIVGFIGNVPVKFKIHGEPRIAAAAASWYVDPSVRGVISLRLFKEYLNQGNVDLFLFKTEDVNLAKVILKHGFKEHSCLPYKFEYTYVINKIQLITQFELVSLLLQNIRKRESNSFSGYSKLLKKTGKFLFLYPFQRPLNKTRNPSEEVYTSSLCTYCDDSFTRLWDPRLKEFDVAMSRDKATLNWLYFIAGRRYGRKVIQCRRSSDNSLVGYMVFDFISWKRGGLMKLMDTCTLNNDQEILTSLISSAIEVGKQNDSSLLQLWTDNLDADSSFREKFMIKWPAEYTSYIRFSEDPQKYPHNPNIYSCMINPPRGIDH